MPLVVGEILRGESESSRAGDSVKDKLSKYSELENFFCFIGLLGVIAAGSLVAETSAHHPLNLPSGKGKEGQRGI